MRKLTLGLFIFGILVVLTHQAFPHEHHEEVYSESQAENDFDGFLDFILGFDIGAGHLEDYSKNDQIQLDQSFDCSQPDFSKLLPFQIETSNQGFFDSGISKIPPAPILR